jgi:hypothetical protein
MHQFCPWIPQNISRKVEKTIIGAEGKKGKERPSNWKPFPPTSLKKYDHLPQQFQRFHQEQALGLHHHLLLALAVHQQFAASETVPQASLGSPSYLALQNLSPYVPLASWSTALVSFKTARKM